MSEHEPWMELSGGFAPEPGTGDWDELTSLPGPSGFLRALLRELSGVDVAQVWWSSESCAPMLAREVNGRCLRPPTTWFEVTPSN